MKHRRARDVSTTGCSVRRTRSAGPTPRSWTGTSGCPPPSLKRVLDQLGRETARRVAGEADNGEADAPSPVGQRAVLSRRGPQRLALARADCLERSAESVVCPCLHLDHHQVVTSPAEEVD